MYSLGLYIHECSRMRYKEKFHGSCLLCMHSRCYYPINEVTSQLDSHSACLNKNVEEAEALRTNYIHHVENASQGWVVLDKNFEGELFAYLKFNPHRQEAYQTLSRLLPHLPALEEFIVLISYPCLLLNYGNLR